MMFSKVFKAAGLDFAQYAESRIVHAVVHGTYGRTSEFASVMGHLGFVPQGGYKREHWQALFAGFTPTGGGRFNRATLPTFVAAVLALLEGNEGPVSTFDKDEAAAWERVKPAPRAKASESTPVADTPTGKGIPATGATPAPKARNFGADALSEACDLLLAAARAGVMLPEHWASVQALHALAPTAAPASPAANEPGPAAVAA